MLRTGFAALVLFGLSAVVGCAEVQVAPATAAAPATPFQAKAEPVSLARDAELAGNEHHVSMLEGKLTIKVHAVELPKLETRATARGLLYSTLDVKLSEEQTVHCVAYASMVWPGGFVANDLTGMHDWANDGSEVADEEAKTKSELTRFDVATVAQRPTISARATVTNQSHEVVADRKIVMTSTAEYTLSCSDRTVGFDKRFGALVNEAMSSLVVDSPAAAPTKLNTFRVESQGKVVGYKMVESFVDAKKGTTTYTNEAEVKIENGLIVGKDRATTSTANAKGEETAIDMQVVLDGEAVVENLHARKDKKGWRVTGRSGLDLIDKAYPSKTSLVSEMSPSWNSRVKAVASGKKAAQLTVLSPSGALATVVTKRKADGSISLASGGREASIALDSEGIASMITDTTKYERIRFRAKPAKK